MTTSACVYSQSYWLSNASEPWPETEYPFNKPLCGVSWRTLMHLNTSQVKDAGATHWLLAFHQLCTAILNMQQQQPSSIIPSSTVLSSLVILDSMERKCDNMSGWVLENAQDAVLSAHLRKLIEFNHAGEPCDPVSALPFSFTQSPQLFFLGYNETEQGEAKRQAELTQQFYKIQTILTVSSALSLSSVIALGIYCIMLRKRSRSYFCCREKSDCSLEGESYSVSGIDDTLMLEMMSDDDEDIHNSPRGRAPKEKAH